MATKDAADVAEAIGGALASDEEDMEGAGTRVGLGATGGDGRAGAGAGAGAEVVESGVSNQDGSEVKEHVDLSDSEEENEETNRGGDTILADETGV